MMTDDEHYLREHGYPQDAWALSGQQWYTALEVAKQLGISDEGVRKLATLGKFPGAIQHDLRRMGWRIPREGIIHYLADLHRVQDQRRRDSTAG